MKKKCLYSIACCALAAALVFAGCERTEDNLLPGDAGVISGAAANVCPEKTVELSVAAVAKATSYVWYRDEAVVEGASGATYVAVASGTYAVAGKNEEGEGKRSPAKVVNIAPCAGEEGAVPADARAITGPDVNDCPSRQAVLSVEPIAGASSYQWYTTYGVDDVDSVLTVEASYTADFSALLEGASVSFTVAGVNAVGTGVVGPPHVVTKRLCIGTPEIVGTPAWAIDNVPAGLSAIYEIPCPETKMNGTAICTSDIPITGYRWYWQEVGGDSELRVWQGTADAQRELGSPGYTYNYAVVALTDEGESAMSEVIQVRATVCCNPLRPGNANVALYPTASGFYPSSAPYDVVISNCDVQERTNQVETSVALSCNIAQPSDADHPVLGYSYWVKTSADGSYTKVFSSTATSSAARTIQVDGSAAFPSGTYAVTAFSSCGDSPFGSNRVVVNIRNDCPPPSITLPAPTVGTVVGGTVSDGIYSNVCPKADITSLSLNIPSGAGSTTNVKWTRTAPTPGVVWEGADKDYITGISVAHNGTYSVTYTRDVDGTAYESPALEVVIGTKVCPPTFASKPGGNVLPADYAVIVVAEPAAVVAPYISEYRWFLKGGRQALSTEVTNIGTASSLTFHVLRSGTYTVQAISAYGNSEHSEDVVVTITEGSAGFSRDDLLGSYAVNDWNKPNANGCNTKSYELTITVGAADDEIQISNLGNRKTGGVAHVFNATVAFTTDGDETGIYGTITIPKQTSELGGVFTKITNYAVPPTCSTDDVVIEIKSAGGKPTISQTGIRYAIWVPGAACPSISYVDGGCDASSVLTWTKN